MPHYKVV